MRLGSSKGNTIFLSHISILLESNGKERGCNDIRPNNIVRVEPRVQDRVISLLTCWDIGKHHSSCCCGPCNPLIVVRYPLPKDIKIGPSPPISVTVMLGSVVVSPLNMEKVDRDVSSCLLHICLVAGTIRSPPTFLHNDSQLSIPDEWAETAWEPPNLIAAVHSFLWGRRESIATVHSHGLGSSRAIARLRLQRNETCASTRLCVAYERGSSSSWNLAMAGIRSRHSAASTSHDGRGVGADQTDTRKTATSHAEQGSNKQRDPLEIWWERGEKVWFLLEGLGSLYGAWYMTVKEHKGTTLLQAVRVMDPRIQW